MRCALVNVRTACGDEVLERIEIDETQVLGLDVTTMPSGLSRRRSPQTAASANSTHNRRLRTIEISPGLPGPPKHTGSTAQKQTAGSWPAVCVGCGDRAVAVALLLVDRRGHVGVGCRCRELPLGSVAARRALSHSQVAARDWPLRGRRSAIATRQVAARPVVHSAGYRSCRDCRSGRALPLLTARVGAVAPAGCRFGEVAARPRLPLGRGCRLAVAACRGCRVGRGCRSGGCRLARLPLGQVAACAERCRLAGCRLSTARQVAAWSDCRSAGCHCRPPVAAAVATRRLPLWRGCRFGRGAAWPCIVAGIGFSLAGQCVMRGGIACADCAAA